MKFPAWFSIFLLAAGGPVCASPIPVHEAAVPVVQVVGTDHFLNRAAPTPNAGGPGAGAVGAAADLAHEVLTRAAVEHTITIYPWARAYSMAKTQPNTLILSMARTPEREQEFKWVGEIAVVRYHLFKLKSRRDIVIKTLDDAKKYQIGVVNQDIAHQHLIARKFPDSALQVTVNYTQSFKKLLLGRVDLVPRSQLGFKQFCEESPLDCDRIDTAYLIDEMDTSLYMAFSKQTSDQLFNRVKTAYDEVRADGTWERIMATALR